MNNKIVRVFLDTNLSCSHLGLSNIAHKNNIKIDTLTNGEFIIFLNRSKTAFKLFTSNNVIIYYKSKSGRLDLNTLRYIPRVFNAKDIKIDYDQAQVMVLNHIKKKI